MGFKNELIYSDGNNLKNPLYKEKMYCLLSYTAVLSLFLLGKNFFNDFEYITFKGLPDPSVLDPNCFVYGY